MNILYLTESEHEQFQALSEELKEGWEVEIEELQYQDSQKHRHIRLHLIRLHDPKMQDLVARAREITSAQDLADLVLSSNLSEVSDADIAELFFAMGPGPLALIVPSLLEAANSDTDVEDLAAITTIRHSLLVAMNSTR